MPSTRQGSYMSFGTVLQNLAIPSHQRQFVRPSRGDEDAIRRVSRWHAREGGGCDQHRWRHVGQYDARECAEPVEPDFRTGVERKLRLCRQGCDFPRRDRRNDQPGSNPVRLPQLPSGRLSQGIPPRNPDYSAGIKQVVGHTRLPRSTPFLTYRSGQVRPRGNYDCTLQRTVHA